MLNVFESTRQFYAQLQPRVILHAFDSTTSTNNLAKDLEYTPELHVFLAKYQTQGRGQFDRQWLNTEDHNGQLLITYSQFYDQPPQPHLTVCIGIALHQSLMEVWPSLKIKIKPPNDLYNNSKKCAGILVETVSQGNRHNLIIGLGLNVTSKASQLSISTSLFEANKEVTHDQWRHFLQTWESNRSFSIEHNWNCISSISQSYLDKYRI
jgi:biotin-[acetyl-CoA-carboxylase] ligase BirA-like protein